MTCGSSSTTAFAHCRPGGMAVFVPDYTAETFQGGTGGGGSTGADGRQGSFREWTWDPDPADDWIRVEYEFTLRAADGTVQIVREAHRLGAFRRDTWLRLLAAPGSSRRRGSPARARPGGAPKPGCPRTCSSGGVRAERAAGPRLITATGAAAGTTGLDNSNRRRGGDHELR